MGKKKELWTKLGKIGEVYKIGQVFGIILIAIVIVMK